MPLLSILFLGDAARPEFSRLRADLPKFGSVADFAEAESAAAAMEEGCFAADVVVVAQATPGQFSHAAIDRLRRAAPLARIVAVLGSWCEGEMRSGSPWPASLRLYWHQWPTHGRREFERFSRGEPCELTLPITAGEEERLLLTTTESDPRTKNGLVLIRSHSTEMWAWLAEACQSGGFAAVWQREAQEIIAEGVTAAIFDATDLGPAECEELRRMSAALHPSPVIVLLSFPRIDQEQLARAAGAAAAFSKPIRVESLLDAVTLSKNNA